MDPWVAAGTILAIVILFACAIGPHEWSTPNRWQIPEIGPSLLVWFGCNALTAAIRLFVMLAQGQIGLEGPEGAFETLTSDETTVLLGGALAAALVGLITIRDGIRGVVQARVVKLRTTDS
ncbi:hypothetical protein OJ997_22900 [Solirubrobacter phytolaccae]|uniref:Uncharacterized protein n=1 Tax=Solirubrobacter phytolaccae TaxID=1404360 RepID=A0A9X3NKN7_9ACTN|nr:hypothetical protein [Solirubrobacter phytolaccae]MDA0183177.1 hypothetical protein [Solirubrobacter phytolaccae]